MKFYWKWRTEGQFAMLKIINREKQNNKTKKRSKPYNEIEKKIRGAKKS